MKPTRSVFQSMAIFVDRHVFVVVNLRAFFSSLIPRFAIIGFHSLFGNEIMTLSEINEFSSFNRMGVFGFSKVFFIVIE